MTLWPSIHYTYNFLTRISTMELLHFAFVMFQLFPGVRPHDCANREKTALMHDPGLSRRVSTTAHSTARWYAKSYNTGWQREKYYSVSAASLRCCCPSHCQYQQKCQQWGSVSTSCQIITPSGACCGWLHNAHLNPLQSIR